MAVLRQGGPAAGLGLNRPAGGQGFERDHAGVTAAVDAEVTDLGRPPARTAVNLAINDQTVAGADAELEFGTADLEAEEHGASLTSFAATAGSALSSAPCGRGETGSFYHGVSARPAPA